MANTEPYKFDAQLIRKILTDPPRALTQQEQDLIRRMRAQEHPVVYSPAHLEAAQRLTYREAPPRVEPPPPPPTASQRLALLLASPKRDIHALQILALHHQDALTPEERVLLLDALMEPMPAPEAEPEPQPEYKQLTATEQWASLEKDRTYLRALKEAYLQDHQRRAMTRHATLGPDAWTYYSDSTEDEF